MSKGEIIRQVVERDVCCVAEPELAKLFEHSLANLRIHFDQRNVQWKLAEDGIDCHVFITDLLLHQSEIRWGSKARLPEYVD